MSKKTLTVLFISALTLISTVATAQMVIRYYRWVSVGVGPYRHLVCYRINAFGQLMYRVPSFRCNRPFFLGANDVPNSSKDDSFDSKNIPSTEGAVASLEPTGSGQMGAK